MAEVWLYYITYIIQIGTKLGLSAKIVPLPHRLDSERTIWALIDSLTAEAFPEGIPQEILEENILPLVPLTWELISARKGPTVEPLKKPQARQH